MKFEDILRGYIPPSDEQRKAIWKQADFVFDTNVLLDVYRYTDSSRVAFFKLLTALKGRVFVPNRVAVEFAQNRLTVIRTHFAPLRLIKDKLEEAAKEIEKKHPKHSLRKELGKLIDSAKSLVDQQFGAAEKKHNTLITDDSILQELLSIIGVDVGDPYPQDEVNREYKRRKEGSIPPFCKVDDGKNEVRRVGDVAIWLEMLKKYEGTGKPLLFVTDDMKENWWQDVGGGRSDAQPLLVQEMYGRSNAQILFYSSERFSERAPDHFGIEVPKGLAEETKEIRLREQRRRSRRHSLEELRRIRTSIRMRAKTQQSAPGLIGQFEMSPEERLEQLRKRSISLEREINSTLMELEETRVQHLRNTPEDMTAVVEERPVTIETVKKQEEPPADR